MRDPRRNPVAGDVLDIGGTRGEVLSVEPWRGGPYLVVTCRRTWPDGEVFTNRIGLGGWRSLLGAPRPWGPYLPEGGPQSRPQARVVNVRKADHWDVYVGRGRCPKTGEEGRWGNPFTVEQHGRAAMRLYLDWLARRPVLIDRAREQLRGKVLGCWCPPGPCHGEVLARLANGEPLLDARAAVLERVAETRDLFA